MPVQPIMNRRCFFFQAEDGIRDDASVCRKTENKGVENKRDGVTDSSHPTASFNMLLQHNMQPGAHQASNSFAARRPDEMAPATVPVSSPLVASPAKNIVPLTGLASAA